MVPDGTNYIASGTYWYHSGGESMEMLSSDTKHPAISGKLGYRATGSTPRGLTRSLVIDVAMPWIAVQLLQRVWGVPTVPAFAVAAMFPATSILLSWVRHRRAEYIGISVLVTILSGIAVALLTNDVRFAVLKGAPAFALFGLACLLSLLRERPPIFFVGRQFTAGDDETCAQAWDCTASERRISSIDAALDARLGPGRPGRGDARDCRSLLLPAGSALSSAVGA